MVACNIIPWSKDKKNRLNPQNGICLNALHDKAFDRGLITVTPDYKIKLSPYLLKSKNRTALEIFFIPFDNQTIELPQRFSPAIEFLRYHNNNIYKS